jgi:hypothetical protein
LSISKCCRRALRPSDLQGWHNKGGVAKAPPRYFSEKKTPTLEHSAHVYEEATDGCRRSLVGTRDNARLWQRVKPDEETNPLAGFD